MASEDTGHGLTRRSFLKTTMLASGAAAVLEATSPLTALAEAGSQGDPSSAEELMLNGSCRSNCFGGCRLKVHVRDGKIVKTTMGEMPDPEYNRICSKGLSHVQRVYGPHRLRYPMRRVAGTERGAGQWERVSWDEAIDDIATKWSSYIEEFGGNSVAFSTSTGNYGVLNSKIPLRLRTLMGASQMISTYDSAVLSVAPRVIGAGPGFYANEAKDLKNAQTVIAWGCNFVNSTPHVWHFIQDAREANGARLISIDPNYTATVSKADEWLALNPATDDVLALAMCKVIIDEGLIDSAFVTDHTVAPLLVKESDGRFLRQSDLDDPQGSQGSAAAGAGGGEMLSRIAETGAEVAEDPFIVWDAADNSYKHLEEAMSPALHGTHDVEGFKVTTAYDLLIDNIEDYTLDFAEDYCGVPGDKIAAVAREIAQSQPASFLLYYGPDHYVNGANACHAICTLASLTGSLGKSGSSTGAFFNIAYWMNGGAITDVEGFEPGTTFPGLYLHEVLDSKKVLDEDVDLKSLFIWDHNPVGNRTDRRDLIECFDKLDLVVVADARMSDTALYADYVLPSAGWFEVEDYGGTLCTPFHLWQDKCIDPLYECRSDYEIIKSIGEAMGFGAYFPSEEELLRATFDTDVARELGLSYDTLKENGAMRGLPSDPYIHAEGGEFSTLSGRAEFYIEDVAVTENWVQPENVSDRHLPKLEPPHEVGRDNPLREKFPLVMTTQRSRFRTHTQWSDVPVMLELDREPTVWINHVDAEERGIDDGDMVRIFNDRGHVVVRAQYHNGIHPGVLMMQKGAEKRDFVDGHYSDLGSRVTDAVYVHDSWFDCLADIEKWKEA